MSDEGLIVPIEIDYEVDNKFDSDKFLKLNLRIIHDGVNVKKTNFDLDVIKAAKDSLFLSPILANVIFDSEGDPQFSSHDKHIEIDKDNVARVIYDEIPIGVIPQDSKYEYKKENGKTYVYATAYIWKKYSNYSLDILNRDKNIKLSMEINVSKYKLIKDSKIIDIKQFKYDGITLLGNTKNPGMKNATAIVEYENKDSRKEQSMIELMDALKKSIDGININNGAKGGNEEVNKKNEEVITENEVVYSNESQENTQTVNNDSKDKEQIIEDTKENYELTFNEIYKTLNEKIKDLISCNGYCFVNDFDSEYVYYTLEHYIDRKTIRKTLRRSYSINEKNEAVLKNDETETVYKILTIDEWNELENQRKAKDIEFEQLQEFKKTALIETRKSDLKLVFEKFDDLLNDYEEYVSLKDNNDSYSIEEIEEKCFALHGRKSLVKQVEFEDNQETNKVEVVVAEVDNNTYEDTVTDPYGGILAKHYQKNK